MLYTFVMIMLFLYVTSTKLVQHKCTLLP